MSVRSPPLRSLVGGRDECTHAMSLGWRCQPESDGYAYAPSGAWVGMALSWVAVWAFWVTDRDSRVVDWDHGTIRHMCCPVHVGTCTLSYVYPHTPSFHHDSHKQLSSHHFSSMCLESCFLKRFC